MHGVAVAHVRVAPSNLRVPSSSGLSASFHLEGKASSRLAVVFSEADINDVVLQGGMGGWLAVL